MSDPIPVLLDTDIGGDIDDAVALAYLLAQPRCELVGVTTVAGAPLKRAALASAICRAAGRDDVPIRPGAPAPLVRPWKGNHCPQAEVLPRFPHAAPESFEPNSAVPFMRELIRSRPGEITLLAIGPMTNLGLLFALDRDIASLLKGVVLMCGDFLGQAVPGRYAEWNALCDPEATAVTYSPRGVDHLSIGLNVTMQCRMATTEAMARFGQIGGPMSIVAAAAEVWGRRSPGIVFHDPLAAAVIFEPGLIETREGLVTVELKSDRAAGMTYIDPNAEEKPHRVAAAVTPAAFLEHYFGVVARFASEA